MIGRAVKALTNGPRASSEEATLAKLRELHPSAAELDGDDDEAERWDAVLAADSAPSAAPAAQENDEEPAYMQLLMWLENHRDHAAAGPDGWTANLLVDIIGTDPKLLPPRAPSKAPRPPPPIISRLANAILYALDKKAPAASPAADAAAATAEGAPVSSRSRSGGGGGSARSAPGASASAGAPRPQHARGSFLARNHGGSDVNPALASAEISKGMRESDGKAPGVSPAPAPGDSVRPIAIGSILRRLAAGLLLSQNRSDIEEALGRFQYGFTLAGRESIMVQINTLLELHPDWVVAGLDIRNDFNTVSRLAVLEECQAKLPQLFAYAPACYADASTLFYLDDDAPHRTSTRPSARSRVTISRGCSSPLPTTARSSTGSTRPSPTCTSSASGTTRLSWDPPTWLPGPSHG